MWKGQQLIMRHVLKSETVSFKQFWKGNDNLVLLKGINLFISYTLYKLFGVSWVWKDTVTPTQDNDNYYFFESWEQINQFLNWFIKMLFHLAVKRQLFCNLCFLMQRKLCIFLQYPVNKVLCKQMWEIFFVTFKETAQTTWLYFLLKVSFHRLIFKSYVLK